jgi:hypothetical protein
LSAAITVIAAVLVATALPAQAEDPKRDVGFRNRTFTATTWSDGSSKGGDGSPHATTGGTSSKQLQGQAKQTTPAAGPGRGGLIFRPFDFVRCTFGCTGPPPATPEVVARQAVARLKLAAPKPAVGPPPSINRWKMAAVGYPLWLWVDGNTNPAPVTDSDGPLSVRLDARITGISFDMGDGHTVSCAGAGTKWTRSVAAGQPSPTCGYRYTKPSLPDGNYTVTATTHWAIDWNINGTTGTIPYTQSASTPVPVGELQVLVR